MRISDWSSDVCSSDLRLGLLRFARNDEATSLSFVMIGDEPVEQAHTITGRALGIGRTVLVVPCHARDIEMRPGDPLVHEALQKLRFGDRAGLARADLLDVGDRAVAQLVVSRRQRETPQFVVARIRSAQDRKSTRLNSS